MCMARGRREGAERARGRRDNKDKNFMNKTHQHLIYLVVATDAGGFPSSVVTAWVTLVELETIVRIPSHVEDGHTKGTLPWTRKRRGVGERRGGREEEEERKWKKRDEEGEEERNE